MEITTWIWSSIWLVELSWVLRLWRFGLARRYPCLTTYLALSATHSIASLVVVRASGQNSPTYGWLWMVTQPILWTLLLCVVIEAYNRMFSHYEGLRRLGELGVYGALGAVSAVILALVILDPAPDSTAEYRLALWLGQERSVYLALTILSALLVFIGSYWRLAVPRNVLVVFGVFGLIFATHAGLLVFRNYFGSGFREIKHLLAPALYVACLAAGTLAFSPAGEKHPEQGQPDWNVDEDTRLITRRLESVNKLLLKVLRS